ncbi:MAG: hypothetical protein IJV45_11555 [Prevotella sp.]|nr:hypothetical protein [Prevotella sp.]
MNKDKEFWDAKKILQEYILFADEKGSIRYAYPSGRLEALETALRAYGKQACFSYQGCRGLISPTCSEEKRAVLGSILLHYIDDEYMRKYIEHFLSSTNNTEDRAYLFEIFFQYKKRLYSLEHIWSGVMECSPAIHLGIMTTSNLTKSYLEEVTDMVDRILILLMGDDYDRTI